MKRHFHVDGSGVAFFDDYFFQRPQALPGADAASFQALGDWLAKDARQVYFLHTVIAEADAATFEVLGGYNAYWARDRHRGYWFWPTKSARRYKALPSSSVDSFEIVPDSRFQEFARDRDTVYYGNGTLRRLRGADPSSFRPLRNHPVDWSDALPSVCFSRDNERVFFRGQAISDAQADRFAVIWAPYGPSEFGVDPTQAFSESFLTGKIQRTPHALLTAEVLDRYRTAML